VYGGLYTPPCIPIGLLLDYQTPLGLHLDFSEFFLAEVSAKFLIPVQAYPNRVQTETWKERIPAKESLNGLNFSLVISTSLRRRAFSTAPLCFACLQHTFSARQKAPPPGPPGCITTVDTVSYPNFWTQLKIPIYEHSLLS